MTGVQTCALPISLLVHGLHGGGGVGAPPRLDLPLCFLLFLRSCFLAFHRFLNSRRSITPIALKFLHDLFHKLSFLRQKKGSNRLTGWAQDTPWRAQVSYALLKIQLGPFFWRKKDNLWKKQCKKYSAIGVMDLQEYKKRFSARSGEREIEENREGDPISEGLPPLRRHGGHGPEGDLSSHLGGRPRKKKKEGALSPPLSRWRWSAAGARMVTAIYINNLATIITNFLPLYGAV